jgi:hypothetical protein
MYPLAGWLIDGLPGVFRPGHPVCHCLLIESEHGLVGAWQRARMRAVGAGVDQALPAAAYHPAK